uniref:MEIS N-terminal domain-containing protein n=1 Tax=Angiostrongylus cantonensis TaxID=6313 RepID=A0A0K0D5C8_ANGCA
MQPFGTTLECFDGVASSSCMPKMSDVERIKCHPLMPILELLCEKCGDATHTMQPKAFQMNDVWQVR